MKKEGLTPFEKWLVGNIAIIGILVLIANAGPASVANLLGRGTHRYEATVISIAIIVHTLFSALFSRMRRK